MDGFYGKIPAKQTIEAGDVYDRMIFTLKGIYAVNFKNLLIGMGPATRYRNEKRFMNLPPGYDYAGDITKEYYDLG